MPTTKEIDRAPAQPGPEHPTFRSTAAAGPAPAYAERRDAARKEVDRRAAAMEASNAESMKRMAATKPTPTQRENDLAKVGALDVDEKEDHGAEDEQTALRRQMDAKLSGEPYYTRDVK